MTGKGRTWRGLVAALTAAFAPVAVSVDAAPASKAVEVRPLAVALTKVKKLDPAANASDIGTPGLDVTVGLRATDGRWIRSLGEVTVTKAVDSTGTELPAVAEPAQTITVTTGDGRRVTRTETRSVTIKTTTRPRHGLILGNKPRTEIRRITTANLAQSDGGATATATIKLGAPSPGAKSLKRLEGKLKVELVSMKSHTFGNLRARVGDALDLGRPRNVALEITRVRGGKVELKATGDTSRLGELEFYDTNGTLLRAESVSRKQETSDGVGQAEMSYDFGDLLPAELKVMLTGATETIEAPFAFDNLELP